MMSVSPLFKFHEEVKVEGLEGQVFKIVKINTNLKDRVRTYELENVVTAEVVVALESNVKFNYVAPKEVIVNVIIEEELTEEELFFNEFTEFGKELKSADVTTTIDTTVVEYFESQGVALTKTDESLTFRQVFIKTLSGDNIFQTLNYKNEAIKKLVLIKLAELMKVDFKYVNDLAIKTY